MNFPVEFPVASSVSAVRISVPAVLSFSQPRPVDFSATAVASGSGEYGDLTRDAAAAAAPALMASRTLFGGLRACLDLGAGASAFDGVVDPTGSSSDEKRHVVVVFSGTSSLGGG
tara:strand:- start:533 stop:877 length:345 start_codon:yes stop_codon:yes gene_type:complete